MDYSIFKMPQEPFGFSNNVCPVLGLPPWEKVKFKINTAYNTIEIKLR